MNTARGAWHGAIATLTLVSAVAGTGVALGQEGSRSPAVFADVNKALESQRSGTPYRWSDPRTRQSGTIVVEPPSYRATGEPCRKYTRTVEARGRVVTRVAGVGCRMGKGIWSLTEQPPVRVAAAPPPAAPAPPRATPAPPPSDTETLVAEAPARPAFTPETPKPKPVLIFGSIPTPSEE